MPQTRQLAAIMFTDIAGYTALMGRDEKKAFEILKKNREIQKPLIEKYHGRWIKELGDGVMASFHTVTDAVFCAASIHQAAQNVEGLKLRIGIHLGEVVFEDNDVFGDGVNIASRLQALASIGSTWVSEAVYKNLTNKKEISSEFIKEEHLKNVTEPVKVYEITVKEIPGHLPDDVNVYKNNKTAKINTTTKKTLSISLIVLCITAITTYFLLLKETSDNISGKTDIIENSVATLPFIDISDNKDKGYFSDGMMIEIMDQLFKIKGLRIIPLNSTLKYKNSEKSLQEIAKELGVANLVEGSVRLAGNQVKITIGLFNEKLQTYLWRHTYDDDITDISRIFRVQSDIAENIAINLKTELGSFLANRTNNFPTESREAYDYYLKGKDEFGKYWAKNDTTHINNGIDFYKKAIELDSNFSGAYTGLGEIYWLASNSKNDKEKLKQSKRYLEKAIALDSLNGWAYSELAVVYQSLDWNKDAALKSLQKALELEPGNFEIQIDLFYYWSRMENCTECVKIVNAARNMNPGNYFQWEVLTKMCQNDLNGLRSLALPENFTSLSFIAAITRYLLLEQFDKAIDLLNNKKINPLDPSFTLVFKGEAFALAGDKSKALKIIEQLEDISRTEYIRPTAFALIYLALDDMDKAYTYLERALLQRDNWIHDLPATAPYYFKKQEPKMKEIMGRAWNQ